LVSYGLHFQEKRLFEYVGEYLETIIRLDPSFRTPYLMADTLLTLEPEAPPQEFYRKARRIQDQGLREFPGDQELWNTSGQFLAYLAPSYLTDFDEKMEYRREGARRLMRACELIGSNDNVPYHCITAANLLSEQGNREAMRQFLERVANTSDDPRIQELASGYLRKVIGAEEAERAAARAARFNTAWKTDLSFVPRSEIHAIGPSFDSAACAGITVDPRPGCATSWLFWAESAESSVAP
jgi:tetratricopeptide (TPR) repeat protein